MSKWPKYRIKDVCSVTSSTRIRSSEYEDDGVPFYRGKEIIEKQRGALKVSTDIYIPRERFEEVKRKGGAPKAGELLLTSVGTLGVPYVVREGEEFYFKDGNLTWFREFQGLHGKYLYYWLLSPLGKAELKKCVIGSSQPAYTIVLLKEMEIDCPPLQIQHQITEILSAYDDLIENNTRRIEILEEMARRLYEEWFVQYRFPGHEGVKFKESELGPIPEGWDLTTVAETFEILGGGTPSKSEPDYWEGGQINWYSPTDLTRSGTAFMDESGTKITDIGLSRSSAKMFPPYSVMLTSRATIGVVAINTTPAATNQGFITCIPNKRFPLYLLFHWIKNNVDRFISLGTGATFKEITKGVFKGIELVVPPTALVDDFQQKVAPLMDMILRLQRKNRNLRTQRDLLLPKLISGEIDVSDIPMPT